MGRDIFVCPFLRISIKLPGFVVLEGNTPAHQGTVTTVNRCAVIPVCDPRHRLTWNAACPPLLIMSRVN